MNDVLIKEKEIKTYQDFYPDFKVPQEEVEKKNSFNYWSWASCWRTFKRFYPEGYYKNLNPNQNHIVINNKITGEFAGAAVYVQIFKNKEDKTGHIEYLEVTNFKNQVLKEYDIRDIQYTLKRCLVKAIAIYTGIGLDMWIDLDQDENDNKATIEKPSFLTNNEREFINKNCDTLKKCNDYIEALKNGKNEYYNKQTDAKKQLISKYVREILSKLESECIRVVQSEEY